MKIDQSKVMIAEAALAEAVAVQSAAVGELLVPAKPRANVLGVGVGVKWTEGMPTGEPALVVLVSHKVDKSQLRGADVVPSKVNKMQTDVMAIGQPFAGLGGPAEVDAQTLAVRVRPAKSGYSVGHVNITAGTLGTCCYDILPDGGSNPPRHGVGIPPRYYILSNNHVLANTNEAKPGDPILQPGPYDGGKYPADQIAKLSRFIPITLDPPVDRSKHQNYVDAAIAEAAFHDIDRSIYWVGRVRGWQRKTKLTVGTIVKKTGRTTNFTVGRVTVINATVDVNYGGGKVGRFTDQIVTTAMSAGGDSGSLVLTLDNVAVGLLFAGSSVATIINHIEYVRALLGVEVAEEIL